MRFPSWFSSFSSSSSSSSLPLSSHKFWFFPSPPLCSTVSQGNHISVGFLNLEDEGNLGHLSDDSRSVHFPFQISLFPFPPSVPLLPTWPYEGVFHSLTLPPCHSSCLPLLPCLRCVAQFLLC